MFSGQITFSALKGIAAIKSGDCVASAVARSAEEFKTPLKSGDVVVIAQKVISKSEGRTVDLRSVIPSPLAQTVAREVDKDPRLVEVILGQSKKIVRKARVAPGKGRLIVETLSGMIMANAGVDVSNTGGAGFATLLPVDSDVSARVIASNLRVKTGAEVAVIVSDTAGRPWREGLVDIAIGCHGIKALADRRGEKDMDGVELVATEMAVADQIVAAAGILMEKNGGYPVVVVRGLRFNTAGSGAGELLRSPSEDLFR